ncbi:uncharacterized protein [Drosophila virilis]|uniref:Uncharacterized protein n=1 Tax=Drosophila virilis TaxID=7244 RepID=B4LPH2_DROVI|nr:uncharacterized protein LOC6626272 [Drosophila virilis]EDW61231.1 uncharacterized protein Dvir_GJ20411 [Drosophila virilis]
MSRAVWYISLLGLCLILPVQLGEQRIRAKRFLIFPRQAPTRHQFIAGIGIPADLSYESLTVGHVLKAEFFLPYNASVYRQNPFLPEYKHTKVSLNAGIDEAEIRQIQRNPTQLRWQIYAYIEHMLNGYGYNGHECMLQAICEANAIRFSKHFSVVQELLHLVLGPSTTLNGNAAEAYDYILAEKMSSQSNSCDIYDCSIKLLDWISSIIQIN